MAIVHFLLRLFGIGNDVDPAEAERCEGRRFAEKAYRERTYTIQELEDRSYGSTDPFDKGVRDFLYWIDDVGGDDEESE